MDWIERWFGLSPDDGDGTLEWFIVILVLLMGVAVMTWFLARSPGLARMKGGLKNSS